MRQMHNHHMTKELQIKGGPVFVYQIGKSESYPPMVNMWGTGHT